MALPVFDNAQYEALLAQRRANDRQALSQQGGIYEAQLGALGTDANLIDARRRANTARLGTIGAQAGLIPMPLSVRRALRHPAPGAGGFAEQQGRCRPPAPTYY